MEMAVAAVGMTIGGYVWGVAGKKAAEEASQAATDLAVKQAVESAVKEAARIAGEQASEKMTKTAAVASGVALVAGVALGAWYNSGSSIADSTSQSNTGDDGSGPDTEILGTCCAEDTNENNTEFVCKSFDPRPKFQNEVGISQASKLEGAAADMVNTNGEEVQGDDKVDPPQPQLIKCVVCFELLVDIHVIEPCLHANVCENCLAKITSALNDGFNDGAIAKCPSCRVEITSTKRIYQ